MARIPGGRGWAGRLAGLVIAVAAVVVLVLVLSAVRLLPQLRNPFGETTTDRSGPVLTFTSAEWETFTAGVKSGKLDLS